MYPDERSVPVNTDKICVFISTDLIQCKIALDFIRILLEMILQYKDFIRMLLEDEVKETRNSAPEAINYRRNK